ncbi:MAG TPA: LD-carboxypeptidase [Bacillota bacterium]|nr:LD-carboxypeptidase [Bacillota bacterium]
MVVRTIRPAALAAGDLLGVVAPASGPVNMAGVMRGKRYLERQGFKVQLSAGVLRRTGYLAGSGEERLADLEEMFSSPVIKGIICLRGGYGSMHLLEKLDYELIAANPKVFVGYSDITALHLAIGQKTGLVTFHGPMLASDWGQRPPPYTWECFQQAVQTAGPVGRIANPQEGSQLYTVVPGKASGVLKGGNLSIITATLGTPFEINTRGCILFLEEIGEQPYRVDRMLTQLSLAGKLQQAAGIVIGECFDCEPRTASAEEEITLAEVFRRCLGALGIPCFYGLKLGHTAEKATLPLGVEAEIDADQCQLVVGRATG